MKKIQLKPNFINPVIINPPVQSFLQEILMRYVATRSRLFILPM